MDIRYHHLLCLPRFEGKGYSADFCKNMANVKKLISLGIKPTPNDVCSDCKWYYICKNLD